MAESFKIYTQISGIPINLYHYTSFAGLEGIVKGKKLWFTNIHYLNDSSEYINALDRIFYRMQREYGVANDPRFKEQFPNLEAITSIYTFSLSSIGDSLSQWRGYCPSGGYSISLFGGDCSEFNETMQAHQLFLGKCIYDDVSVEAFVEEKIMGVSPYEYAQQMDPDMPHGVNGWKGYSYSQIIENVIKYAPLIKDPSFSEEKEWRIIANFEESRKVLKPVKNLSAIPTSSTKTSFKWENPSDFIPFEKERELLRFRQGKSYLIPYLEIPLSKSKPSPVSEVIIGPTPHPNLAVHACKVYLRDFDVEIKPSEIPYRNW